MKEKEDEFSSAYKLKATKNACINGFVVWWDCDFLNLKN